MVDIPTIDDGFTYHGIDAAFLENNQLRILVLPGKGGDILEFRDKRTDVDVLYRTDHNWQPPTDRPIPDLDGTSWHDHYPGGWQVNLPVAGYTDDFGGTPYGLHGESALLPWDATVVRNDDTAVTLQLTVELVRYPFVYKRELTLPAGEPVLRVEESVTNEGAVELEYIWQQHLTLGPPLLGPAARLDVPARQGVVEEYADGHANARLESGASFDWPIAPTADGETVDLRTIPDETATIHDVAFATALEDGWYTLTNPDLDLGFGFAFPTDPFECVWYWQAFGGVEMTPYFGRNYNVGLEPTTAYPSSHLPEAQRETDTIDTLAPGETVTGEFAAVTYPADVEIDGIDIDGTLQTP